MLEFVKTALRRSDSEFNGEIQALIDDALGELEMLGIVNDGIVPEDDPQIKNTVVFYCKWKFGFNDDADRWAKIYRDKVEKLISSSRYGLADAEG